MNSPKSELDKLVEEQEQAAEREKRILADLLQRATDKKSHVLVHLSGMGHTLSETGSRKVVPSYAATHTLEWIANNIKLGSEMPFMERKIDPKTGRLIIDQDNAEEVKQRAPDWTRQPALAAYLAQPQRKFGPIIAVLSPDWIDDPQHENWGSDGRAIKGAAEYTALDLEGRIGLLRNGDVKVYALDGQHRVIGIKGILDVRDKQSGLVMKNRDGREKGKAYSREEFLQRFKLGIEDLQSLLNETMIVEYIPAVIKGETRPEASRRIRNTFISINSYAKRTDKGENILLDETDGHAIVARRAGLSHDLFNAHGKNNRVNWKTTSIPNQRTTWYTTLQTIKEMTVIYLPAVDAARATSWETVFPDQMPIRPSEDELDSAKQDFATFLDAVFQLPVFQALEKFNRELDAQIKAGELEENKVDAKRAEAVTLWREFPSEESPDKKGHVLLRPVGQIILTEAVATLIKPVARGGRGMSLANVFAKLKQLDEAGGFAAHLSANIWFGVTYNDKDQKMVTTTKARSLAHDLLVYLIAGFDKKQTESVWIEFANARMVDSQARTWRNLEGEVTAFDEATIELPKRLSS